ncbi:hypothetical protein [Streptomyces sp. SID3343]|uniref:hypothetical protein n=1 Tax=Streptomyces sp. SID3343 TaxID=2690260 RepID=UPI001371DB34|nr:hypothetical protein [Streptomyces sp. SID3343]MYV98863.1 hypothetical protein [Streptomyces sp. SID3343]
MTNDPRTSGPDPDDLAEAVRRRLHEAVADVRPAPDALDRLRVAVPARRRRRRATTTGAIGLAAALIVAAPMLRTATQPDDTAESNVGQTNATKPVEGDARPAPTNDGLTVGGAGAVGQSVPPSRPPASPTAGATASPTPTTSPSGQSTASTQPTVPVTAPPTSAPPASSAPPPPPPPPACQTTDLIGEDARIGTLGANGLAYGVLQLRNAAAKDCAVSGPGVVVVSSPPGNPVVQVSVVDHVRGDVATALPQPVSSASGITLKHDQTYEFQFAWQPQAPREDGTCAVDAPPAPEPALGYTLASGDFTVAKVRLTPTCGGTLYRTDIYRTGDYPRVG